jgi:hypothetical protein
LIKFPYNSDKKTLEKKFPNLGILLRALDNLKYKVSERIDYLKSYQK